MYCRLSHVFARLAFSRVLTAPRSCQSTHSGVSRNYHTMEIHKVSLLLPFLSFPSHSALCLLEARQANIITLNLLDLPSRQLQNLESNRAANEIAITSTCADHRQLRRESRESTRRSRWLIILARSRLRLVAESQPLMRRRASDRYELDPISALARGASSYEFPIKPQISARNRSAGVFGRRPSPPRNAQG